MTATAKEIRIVHAGDLSTKEAMALSWLVGTSGDRFQEIAICDGKVVGSWTYSVEAKGRSWRIDSGLTEVARRFRRRGIAVRLWAQGIARWRPTHISSRATSTEGIWFLARMLAELAYAQPRILLDVNVDESERDSWTWAKEYTAREKLTALGRAAAPQQKQLPAPQLKALKAAS